VQTSHPHAYNLHLIFYPQRLEEREEIGVSEKRRRERCNSLVSHTKYILIGHGVGGEEN